MLTDGLQDKGGILPGLQKLSYAGKNMQDSQRTLEQCACFHVAFKCKLATAPGV